MQLMLAAARADVPTNTVYLARQSYGPLGLAGLLGVVVACNDEQQLRQQRRSEQGIAGDRVGPAWARRRRG